MFENESNEPTGVIYESLQLRCYSRWVERVNTKDCSRHSTIRYDNRV